MAQSRKSQKAMFAKNQWNNATGNRRFDVLTLGINLKDKDIKKELLQDQFEELPPQVQNMIVKIRKQKLERLSGV